MSKDERQDLIKLLESYQEMQTVKHDEFTKTLKEINDKLDPVYGVYSAFSGFGSIAGGFFKWVVVPCSVIVGIWISFRKLFE